ncbi:antibiotic biosynthesis monooxygenase [Spiractinospora alimapuensis]|uniref:putative quinol monooxygenase n=1 Tax=Spiractinospora alimapuensis TaxID=2820884 RepID=UPI001F275481|nr:antibiotic biosynthesis monooxygenase [Spiractinospora alimapuensis]QVQ50626.1 antibiotic biosynthesis monooxygenase [Spiractinospora alimapuensis]
MVEVGLALICALVAWSATAALTVRCYRVPRTHVVAWLISVVALMVALTGALPAAFLDFSTATFRVFQLGVGLLAPLWAAWGVAEYTLRSFPGRLAVREGVVLFTIVPVVILCLDPLSGTFDGSYPQADVHYQIPAMVALGAAHTFSVVVLVACAVASVLQHQRRDDDALGRLRVIGLIGGAVVIQIIVARMGLGPFGQLALLAALGCLWQAASVAATIPRAIDTDDGRHGGAGDEDEDDEEQEMLRRRRDNTESYAGGESAPRAPRAPRTKAKITIYTVFEGYAEAFDARMAHVVEAVRRYEPETLMFVSHRVPSAPAQRIVYAMYRDDLAAEQHEQQPHIQEFLRDSSRLVSATNVIELETVDGKADQALVAMLMGQ